MRATVNEKHPETSSHDDRIILAHGGGGELTQRLIAERFLPRLNNPLLDPLGDSAIVNVPSGRVAFTTDGHVVQPLEFPGGDIGRLAVCGTVNDLAVMAARPIALSLGMVIEEGLPLATLDRITTSIAAAAEEAGVAIATGDTKVVERSRGDGLTITTAGIGEIVTDNPPSVTRIAADDAIIVTGRIAEHGLAVMSAREVLSFATALLSDVAPLNGLVQRLLDAGLDIKFMRDPTRSGLAGVLADLAEGTKLSVEVHESQIPLSGIARHTAELLGLDPLTVANEGKIVLVVGADQAERAVEVCREDAHGQHAAIIGRMQAAEPPLVELVTTSGGRRLVQRPYGEELPRIC